MSAGLPQPYPVNPAERNMWIVDQRPARAHVDSDIPYAFLLEKEYSADGQVVPIATIFLTNRECPWRCVMCDLWRNTLTESVPTGAIPRQIDYALSRLPAARHIKLYNSGSFFDQRAIPVEDHAAIASRASCFERTIVECHPSLIGNSCLRFRDLLPHQLEIAMGLETTQPEVLDRLNKRMNLNQFSDAAAYLRRNEIDLRVFILIQPPFMRREESLYWAKRSLDFAFDCGATAASLIPTRGGNGAMESLSREGEFAPPTLNTIEAALGYGLALKRGRVFVDLWDIRRVPVSCPNCLENRIDRLQQMNLLQQIGDPVSCRACGENY